MCMAMYLYTEKTLEEIEWNNNDPKMFIENLTLKKERGEDIGSDIGAFNWNDNNRKVYYIGSSQGCGCGWGSDSYDEVDMNNEDEKNEFEDRIKDRNDLYKLLKSEDFNESYIIVCWEGEQWKELIKTVKLNIEKIKNVEYEFNKLVKYILYD